MKLCIYIFTLAIALMGASCSSRNDSLFTLHNGPDTGISFQNTITTNDSLNALTFEYIYNGSGIGVGDFNGDGREDLYFGGNLVSSRLYINKGNLQFEDVTEVSGTTTSQWVTGISIVDINADGRDDIYVCVAGPNGGASRKNLLFINQGVTNGAPVFKESAAAYGLDDDSYSTMAAFFDYDKDGDLDMYLLNNWLETFNRNNLRPKRIHGESQSTDQLYRNNGDNTFTNVSREAGIQIEGYGLGVVITDINHDSWPDIYTSNDFMSNDILWINQGDGTFRNEIARYLKHQTHNGMGVDIADFNNDSREDIVVVDMLPPGHKRQKMMTPGQNYDHFHMSLDLNYQPQYMRNTLQLNRGNVNDSTVLFSEIAFLSGIAQTDWSWAPLFVDVDNDGLKDLFIGNGYRKDVTDLDFIFFGLQKGSPFGTPESRRAVFNGELDKLPEVKLTNYLYRNNGSLVFEDKTKAWGVDFPTFTNGTVYVDLDNDGDIDFVTNNIDQDVILYENNTDKQQAANTSITVTTKDIGSLNEIIRVFSGASIQTFERTPYRGFESTVTKRVHAGIGKATEVDSVEVTWPDQTVATYYHIAPSSVLEFSKKDAKNKYSSKNKLKTVEFTPLHSPYRHIENSPSDIKTTRTLLHEVSRYGPCLAVADVNGDGLDDFFVGAERGSYSYIMLQDAKGAFTQQLLSKDSLREDGGALFFDYDNDGDQDLYVAAACPSLQEAPAQHLLYSNNGNGQFTLINDALPSVQTSASCVLSADFDNDGDLDLFIGGRIKTKAYPMPPRSYVLRNDNGKFTDVTHELNPELETPGMVSSAAWVDIDQDQRIDLVLAGEWMPIRVFRNTTNGFEDVTATLGLSKTNGWWNSLKVADINRDGFPDLIAGNTGKNSYFHPTVEQPVQIVARDFDNNGSVDPIITYYNPVEKDRFMIHNRLVLIDQIPAVKKRFETFTQFATTPFKKSFPDQDLSSAYHADLFTLASCVFVNVDGKRFECRELPEIAQVSCINDILATDLNGDDRMDMVLIGNNYSQETQFGMYDASVGTILLGDGNFGWQSLEPDETHFIVDQDARALQLLSTSGDPVIVIVNNNGPVDLYRISKQQKLP